MELSVTLENRFVQGAARALFVLEWANEMERQGITFPGAKLEDVAPATPLDVLIVAARLLGCVEQLNGLSLAVIWANAREGEGHRRAPTVEDFGWAIAMQALGTGVAWTDDHPEFSLPGEPVRGRRGFRVPAFSFDLAEIAYWDAGIRQDFAEHFPARPCVCGSNATRLRRECGADGEETDWLAWVCLTCGRAIRPRGT